MAASTTLVLTTPWPRPLLHDSFEDSAVRLEGEPSPKNRSTERVNPYVIGVPLADRALGFKIDRRVHLEST